YHRERLKYILHQLPRIDEGASPRFVIAHIIAPHPPFVLGADGSAVARTRRFNFTDGSSYFKEGGKRDEYRTGYTNQVTYLNYRLRGIIDTLVANNPENPPIIILQADHGPGSELRWEGLHDTNVKERFSILNAYYLPGVAESTINSTITPVNTYRIIFNSYFGTSYKQLPAK
ncbi:MAG: LTA synthase family protein, partial [Planctomycetes bacterium]|nr:LTA synthase family protein [Planctomycetota bacterium]